MSTYKVLITGGSKGIGLEIAKRLSKDDKISVIHILGSSNEINRVSRDLNKNNNKIVHHKVDLSNRKIVNEFCKILNELDEKPNVIINAAGILGEHGNFSSLDYKDYDKVFNINFLSSLKIISCLLEDMKKNNFGRIINFAGGGAAYPYPEFMPYSLSKVAVVRMTENIAKELEEGGYDNIFANVIAPGAVETDMLKELIKKGGYVKTKVNIEEPVNLVNFLIFNENNKINGKFIHSRDDYVNIDFNINDDLFTLRRIED